MFFATFLAAAALSVPVGSDPQNHAQPWHSGAPVIRRFERRADDDVRRRNWEAYCRQLDELWDEYRATGSMPRAFEIYKDRAATAKREYLIRDIYLVPFLP